MNQDVHLSEILIKWNELPAQTKLDLEAELNTHIEKMKEARAEFKTASQKVSAFDKAFMDWTASWVVSKSKIES